MGDERINLTPISERELLIEALRTVNRMGDCLNQAASAMYALGGEEIDDPKFTALYTTLLRRFTDCSGVHLFASADRLGLRLPVDLRGEAAAS